MRFAFDADDGVCALNSVDGELFTCWYLFSPRIHLILIRPWTSLDISLFGEFYFKLLVQTLFKSSKSMTRNKVIFKNNMHWQGTPVLFEKLALVPTKMTFTSGRRESVTLNPLSLQGDRCCWSLVAVTMAHQSAARMLTVS